MKQQISLVISAGTYDSTLCGWKYLCTYDPDLTPEERLKHVDAVEEEEQVQDSEDEEKAQELVQFLRAVEEEQKKLKQGQTAKQNDDESVKQSLQKEEELFQFLRAVEAEQLKTLQQERDKVLHDPTEVLPDNDDDANSSSDDDEEIDNTMKFVNAIEKQDRDANKPEQGVAPNALHPLFAIKPHTGSVNTLTGYGRYVASAGYDENVNLFDVRKNKKVSVLHKLEGSIGCVSFIDAGRCLCVASQQGTLSIHKLSASLMCIWTVPKAHKGVINSMSEHPSRRILMTTGIDRKLKLWNMFTGKMDCSIILQSIASSAQWSTSGATLAVVVKDTVDIYESATLTTKCQLKPGSKVHCAKYLSDNMIALGAEDKMIYIYNTETGECVHKLEVHQARVKDIAVQALSSDEFLVISVCSAGGIAVWRIYGEFAALESYSATGARFTCVSVNRLGIIKQAAAATTTTSTKRKREQVQEDEEQIPEEPKQKKQKVEKQKATETKVAKEPAKETKKPKPKPVPKEAKQVAAPKSQKQSKKKNKQ